MSVWLVINGEKSLNLRNVTRDANGRIASGHVINGNWELELRGDELLAKDTHGNIVTRQPCPDFHEVPDC